MQSQHCESLNTLLTQHNSVTSLNSLQLKLKALTDSPQANMDELIHLYQKAIPLIETALWQDEITEDSIQAYQKLFREMETLIATQESDNRFSFVVIIPVADRPQHLQACLSSLLELCRLYNYGSTKNGSYRKISVIIADDSKHAENIEKNKMLAHDFTNLGLTTDYFGLKQQFELINSLSPEEQENLSAILGNMDKDNFSHKGPSIMRNITYLKLGDIAQEDNKTLFFFIDSDQEFRIKANTKTGDKDIFSTNYFYYLNEIFSRTNASILTGKVVGDPPVSPSVMTSRFLDDVLSFLQQISQAPPHSACGFHNSRQADQDGAYHDMAELFGFNTTKAAYDYSCSVTWEHDHSQCLMQFASTLNHFFYGEHPTRTSYYHHEDIMKNIKAARTIYTGNYVLKADALKYFIPFAALKLRMAGPVLGRLIKTEISNRFVSANLPMLHKRTVEDTGQSEFRPGIEQQSHVIDLSGEFERQFFGDIMLFTIERLTQSGFPLRDITQGQIHDNLAIVENEILRKYLDKHEEIARKLERLKSVFHDPGQWWNTLPDLKSARSGTQLFINNIEHNFGEDSKGYKLLCSPDIRQQQLNIIADAIARYKCDRASWEKTLAAKIKFD